MNLYEIEKLCFVSKDHIIQNRISQQCFRHIIKFHRLVNKLCTAYIIFLLFTALWTNWSDWWIHGKHERKICRKQRIRICMSNWNVYYLYILIKYVWFADFAFIEHSIRSTLLTTWHYLQQVYQPSSTQHVVSALWKFHSKQLHEYWLVV